MPVRLCRPIRGPRLSLTPFGMCRSTPSPSNSRSFCRYKTPSHLHISQLLKVPQFQRFAQKSCLTPLTCADTQMRGWGGASLYPASLQIPPPYRNSNVFSRLHTPNFHVLLFSAVYKLRGGRGGTENTPAVSPAGHQSPVTPVTSHRITSHRILGKGSRSGPPAEIVAAMRIISS